MCRKTKDLLSIRQFLLINLGWYKRYFLLEKGVLTYGKSPEELKRGRTHGKINLGETVISFKTEGLRIDINDEVVIHHLKAPDDTQFFLWKEKLKQHTYFKQDQVKKNALALW